MGTVCPEDFDLSKVEKSLATVVEILRDRTDDDWLIVPHVPFVDHGSDGEVDLVLLHPTIGGIMLEVKGGQVEVRDGTWYQNGRKLDRSPVDQVVHGKHALKRKFKRVLGGDALAGIRFWHGVVFPDVPAVPDGMIGPDLEQSMVLTKLELGWPEDALRALASEKVAIAAPQLDRLLRTLKPTVDFTHEFGNHLRGVSRRLGEVTENMIRTAENLFANQRVLVTGPAGVGKTRLATAWARRGSREGARVLLTCFNIPIGSQLAVEFSSDPNVTAGPFLELVIDWLEQTSYPVPAREDRDSAFYDSLPEIMVRHRHEMDLSFDVVILDEVQDFKASWFTALRALLDPAGAQKEFRLGDPNQNLFNAEVMGTEGFVVFPLSVNCRNTQNISAVARRVDSATETFPGNPPGPPVRFHRVGGSKEVLKRVRREIEYLVNEQYVAPSDIVIMCTTADERNQIVDQLAEVNFDELAGGLGDVIRVVRWEDRDEDAVLCETSHRLKGTEWHAVVLVNREPLEAFNIAKAIYVGVTRATTWLTVVGSDETGRFLGLQPVTRS